MNKKKTAKKPKKIGFMKWVTRKLIQVLILTIIAYVLFWWVFRQGGSWM